MGEPSLHTVKMLHAGKACDWQRDGGEEQENEDQDEEEDDDEENEEVEKSST